LIKLVGAKGNIQNIDLFLKEILSLADKYDIVIQVMDADWIYGKNHLISAINLTICFRGKTDSKSNKEHWSKKRKRKYCIYFHEQRKIWDRTKNI